MSGVTLSISVAPRKKPSAGQLSRPSTTTLGALLGCRIDVGGDLVAVLAGDQRAHLRIGLHPVADLHVRDPLLDRGDERIGRVADRHDDRNRHAALAGRAVRRRDGRVGGHVDVSVRQHDHVILGPAERLTALPTGRGRLVDVAGDRRRADERDRGDARMLEQRVDGHLVAVDDVEHAVRNTGLLAAARRCTARPRDPSRTASARTCCRTRAQAPTSTSGPSPGS